VEGNQDIDIQFAKCCNPIKGDSIVGYITQNRGLVIHKKTCSNIQRVLPSRLKEVEWIQAQDYTYAVKYDILVQDRPGVLSAISGVNADYDSNIKKIEVEALSHSMSKIRIVFEVKDTGQLDHITGAYRKVKGVYSILRKRIVER